MSALSAGEVTYAILNEMVFNEDVVVLIESGILLVLFLICISILTLNYTLVV